MLQQKITTFEVGAGHTGVQVKNNPHSWHKARFTTGGRSHLTGSQELTYPTKADTVCHCLRL